MVVDALSRLSAVDYGAASRGISREDLFKGQEQAYHKDKETKTIMENLDVHREYSVIQNKLYYTGKGRMQLYLPLGKFSGFYYSGMPQYLLGYTFGRAEDRGTDQSGFLLANNSGRCDYICANM